MIDLPHVVLLPTRRCNNVMGVVSNGFLRRCSRRCRSASLARCPCGNCRTRSSWSRRSVRFGAVWKDAIYDSAWLDARARSRELNHSCLSRFL